MTLPTGGVRDVHFSSIESTYDVITNNTSALVLGGADAVAAADAFQCIALEIEPALEYHEIGEHTGDGSLEGEVEGKRGGRFTLTARARLTTNGNSTPVPVLSDFFEAAFPAAPSESAGTSMTYALSSSVAPDSLYIVKHSKSDNKYEAISGCWIESMEVEIPGEGELPILTFEGGFASYAHLYGVPNVSGDQSADTAIELAAADLHKISKGAVVAFAGDNNSGNGFVVTAVDSSGNLTIHTAATCSDTDAVTPIVPTETLAGSVVGGIACSLTIGGTSVGMISGKFRLETGIKGLDRESTTDRPSEIVFTGDRRVTGEFEFYMKDETAQWAGDAWNGTTYALVMRVGPNTAGSRLTLTANAARLNVVKLDAPNDDVVTYSASFKARKNSSADDELTAVTS